MHIRLKIQYYLADNMIYYTRVTGAFPADRTWNIPAAFTIKHKLT